MSPLILSLKFTLSVVEGKGALTPHPSFPCLTRESKGEALHEVDVPYIQNPTWAGGANPKLMKNSIKINDIFVPGESLKQNFFYKSIKFERGPENSINFQS